ncbi:hypothetical protein POM88_047638 [Heracleum sosnowskyi]|uniref:MATH domain-containing protein n=1 Tax=Heracleum sosnowskyi TaxID=360622 RepID=A0AAD8GSJ7_9APIA|nr:hypothetical protein POM88_047638 [Heracleum sosnowskyi]
MGSVYAGDDDNEGAILREWRDTPPAHYLIKVQSFSLCSKHGVDQIITNNFQAGQQEWKIILFPNGKDGGKGDHLSIYLMLESTSSLAAGKDVNAIFKFFLFDQIRGKYLTVLQGRAKRFDWLEEDCYSAKFCIGGHLWKLWLCPNGNLEHKESFTEESYHLVWCIN